jgi:hypothetical protein
MKSSLLVAAFLTTASLAFANEAPSCACSAPATVSTAPAQAAATAPTAYPLDTCVVSGEKLGEMGAPVDYIHKEAGKPDRLVRFCCKMCIAKFKKDPAKYLKVLDEAAAAKQKA